MESGALEYLESGRGERRFAGIFCSHLIEHLSPSEAERLTRGMASALSPGGRLVVITPNPTRLSVLGGVKVKMP